MVRIALGQLNTTVGDLDGNVDRLATAAADATAAGADVVVFPELAITGYPPEDLVLRPAFVRDNLAALEALAARTAAGCDVVVGFADRSAAGVHNAAALLRGGAVIARYAKCKLPNYGVFDERRTFVPGDRGVVVEVAGTPRRSVRVRGRLGARPALRQLRRHTDHREPQRLAVPPRARPTSAPTCFAPEPPRPAHGSCT